MKVERERLRMAFAEAGYPGAILSDTDSCVRVVCQSIGWDEVCAYRAFLLVLGPEFPCFDCWLVGHTHLTSTAAACVEGNCQSASALDGD